MSAGVQKLPPPPPGPRQTRIQVHSAGVPVALVDELGDVIEGTLWGAQRAAGAIALVCTELNLDDRHGPAAAPTPDQLAALGGLLGADWKAGQHGAAQERARELFRLLETTRDQLDTARTGHREARARAAAAEAKLADTEAGLVQAVSQIGVLTEQVGKLSRDLTRATTVRPGQLRLMRAAARHQARKEARRQVHVAAAVGATVATAVGFASWAAGRRSWR